MKNYITKSTIIAICVCSNICLAQSIQQNNNNNGQNIKYIDFSSNNPPSANQNNQANSTMSNFKSNAISVGGAYVSTNNMSPEQNRAVNGIINKEQSRELGSNEIKPTEKNNTIESKPTIQSNSSIQVNQTYINRGAIIKETRGNISDWNTSTIQDIEEKSKASDAKKYEDFYLNKNATNKNYK